MSENKKLWKVTITVAQSDCEGKCEIGREKLSQIFDNFTQAEAFAHSGFKWDPWHKVLNASIVEYDVKDQRELPNKTDDEIIFGKYKKTLVWDVIDETDDAQLLLCRDIVEQRIFDPASNDWETSDIRSWLNNYDETYNHSCHDYSGIGFINAFDRSELKQFNKTRIKDDFVFLLSKDEYEAYKENIKRVNGYWWLRSSGTYPGRVASVFIDGSVYCFSNVDSVIGVRPALWINKE
jgi:hypothetical protein